MIKNTYSRYNLLNNKYLCLLVFILLLTINMNNENIFAEDYLFSNKDNTMSFKLNAEYGFFKVLYHKIQFGENSNYFDYVKDGNQDILLPFSRYSGEFNLYEKHSFILLYQPLEIKTQTLLKDDLIEDGVVFQRDTIVNLRYSFPFWRFSYLYHLISSKNTEFSIGGGMQIRNASISFESADNSKYVINQNIGPVPLIKIRGKYTFNNGFFLGTEIDGFYASIKFINGGKTSVKGAIYDVSLFTGVNFTDYFISFLNIRFLGGGGEGSSTNEDELKEKEFTKNWLHTMSVTLGVTLR